jgi:hypothetical protein
MINELFVILLATLFGASLFKRWPSSFLIHDHICELSVGGANCRTGAPKAHKSLMNGVY